MGTYDLRGVGRLAAALHDHHDVEDLEDGAGHHHSNPSGGPPSLDTWSYPVHASRTGQHSRRRYFRRLVVMIGVVNTSSSKRINWVTDERGLQEQIVELENETSRLHQLLRQMEKSKTTPCRQPRSEPMCYDPRTATVPLNCITV